MGKSMIHVEIGHHDMSNMGIYTQEFTSTLEVEVLFEVLSNHMKRGSGT